MSILNAQGEHPVRGDDLKIFKNVTDVPAGDFIVEAWLTVKLRPTDPDVEAVAQLVITASEDENGEIENNGAAGTARLRFDFGDTDYDEIVPGIKYHYDVQALSNEGYYSTPRIGTVKWRQDITLST